MRTNADKTLLMNMALKSSPMSLRFQLREATRPHHDRVEHYLAIHETIPSRCEYRRLLETLWGFYHPLELALARLDWRAHDIELAARRKSDWLFADLVDLGRDPHEINKLPVCSHIPALTSATTGLGVLYVLEGATLGGQLIIRHVGPQLGVNDTFAGRFFASYGLAVGPMWRKYIAALEQAGFCGDARDAIERAAIETFCALQVWFETAAGLAPPGFQTSRPAAKAG